jgi:nicotinamide riboside kinase
MSVQEVKKVVVIGPESTGKSTLCSMLAAHYNTIWCHEYAREYLLNNGTDYTYNDLLTIARGQLLLQDEAEQTINKTGYNLAAPPLKSKAPSYFL